MTLGTKTLLKFSASIYCKPCKELDKVILATDLGDIDYQEVDVTDDLNLAKHWNIRGVPTLLLLDENEEELNRHTGLLSSVGLQNFVGYDPDALDDQEEEHLDLKEPWKETW